MSSTKSLYLNGVNGSYASTRQLAESSTGLTAASPTTLYDVVPTANLYTAPLPSRGSASALATQNASAPLPDGTGFELDSSAMDSLHLESNSALSLTVVVTTTNTFTGTLYGQLWRRKADGTYAEKVGQLSVGGTFQNTKTLTMTGSQILSGQFATGDRLYLHLYFSISSTETNQSTITLAEGDGHALTITTLTHAEYQAAYAPANDDWASAIALTATSGSDVRTNVRATYEAGEPIPPITYYYLMNNQDGLGSIWWKWTAPADGSVHTFFADTSGSRNTYYNNVVLNTRMAVYTGDSVSGLTEITYLSKKDDIGSYSDNGGDPNSNNKTSSVSFTPVAGTTYYIQVCVQMYNADANTWYGNVHLNWTATGRGPWMTPAPITDVHNSQAGTAPWNLGTYAPYPPDGGTYYQVAAMVSDVYAGGWYMWRGAGQGHPADYPAAYMCCTAHARYGEMSNHQVPYNNPDQYGWSGTCAALPPPQDWAAQGYDNRATAGSGLCSGGHASFDSPGSLGGELDYVECSWSFVALRPGVAARRSQYWQQSGSLPPGVVGITYEKEYCDVISLRVRPASAGNSSHPPAGCGPQSDTVHWLRVEVVDGAPGFGFFNTSTTPAQVIHYMTGDPAQFAGAARAIVGQTDWAGGVQTGRTTDWYDCNALETLDPVPQTGSDYASGNEKRYWFVGVADWIMAGESVGTPAGGIYSWTRRVDNMDLEIELVLQPPRYAYLYEGADPGETPNLGVAPDLTRVHFRMPSPTGHGDVVVSQPI